MLFLIISLLIGTTMGAAGVEPTNIKPVTKAKGPCQNIKIQQRQIFEKLARIENQINTKNIID
tara:strand:+ start:324 stop:512 length:189 start_codon:yes stop_codon:yes gene_type:complete